VLNELYVFELAMSLNLTPNEVIGYRIKPDWHSYNVVLVKRHGASSKNAGAEYEAPVAYCMSLPSAAAWVFSHAFRVKGEQSQKERLAIDGSVADVQALHAAFCAAEAHTLQAVYELQGRIDRMGLTRKDLVRGLGAPSAED
jgi:hypothetical protein